MESHIQTQNKVIKLHLEGVSNSCIARELNIKTSRVADRVKGFKAGMNVTFPTKLPREYTCDYWINNIESMNANSILFIPVVKTRIGKINIAIITTEPIGDNPTCFIANGFCVHNSTAGNIKSYQHQLISKVCTASTTIYNPCVLVKSVLSSTSKQVSK